MKYRKFLELVEKATGVKPTHSLISQKLGGKPTAGALSNRYFNDGNLSLQELFVLKSQFSNVEIESDNPTSNKILDNLKQEVEISPEQIITSDDKLHEKYYIVPFWEGVDEEITSRIKDDEVNGLPLGVDYITNKLKCKPENLRIISMLGDDMDGGQYPIRNKDLLLIDISRNQPYETGVFFVTTHGGTRLYVRRIFERMADSARYFTTIDNEIYKKDIEKYWTEEKWIEADVQIVGRVIKNMSYTI